jgi:hypothetical protein
VDKPVELIPMLCLQCSTPVPAEPEELAWVCANCGQGIGLDEEKGLVPLSIFCSVGIPQHAIGKPYWVVAGKVSLDREAYGVFGKQTGEAQRFWNQERRFFIPAFTCPLETKLSLGTKMMLNPPNLQPGPPVLFEPVTLGIEDIKATAEFIVMAVEAGRKDKVKRITFHLELSEPELWILP